MSSARIFWKILDLSSRSCGNFSIFITVTKSKMNNFVLKSHVLFELWNVAVIYILIEEGSYTELYTCLKDLQTKWCWDWINPVIKSSSLFACKGPSLEGFFASSNGGSGNGVLERLSWPGSCLHWCGLCIAEIAKLAVNEILTLLSHITLELCMG